MDSREAVGLETFFSSAKLVRCSKEIARILAYKRYGVVVDDDDDIHLLQDSLRKTQETYSPRINRKALCTEVTLC